jgi:hypothetical protein
MLKRKELFALLVILGIAHQHRVAFAQRGVLDALQNQREKRIRQIGDGDQNLAGAKRAQALRRGIRLVAQPFNGREDPASRGGGDDAWLTEHTGDRGGGNARVLAYRLPPTAYRAERGKR